MRGSPYFSYIVTPSILILINVRRSRTSVNKPTTTPSP